MIVSFKRLNENVRLPKYNNQSDAGIDFFANADYVIPFGRRVVIDTGIAWEPEKIRNRKVRMQLKSRSGLATKHGIICLGGLVDEDYHGEIKVCLLNTSSQDYLIKKGDKFVQGEVTDLPIVKIYETDTLSNTVRGDKGFGSSKDCVIELLKKLE